MQFPRLLCYNTQTSLMLLKDFSLGAMNNKKSSKTCEIRIYSKGSRSQQRILKWERAYMTSCFSELILCPYNLRRSYFLQLLSVMVMPEDFCFYICISYSLRFVDCYYIII